MPAAVPDAKVPPQNLDVRGYYSRRFHVQSCGHVFQVLIKLPRKTKGHPCGWMAGGSGDPGHILPPYKKKDQLV